MCDADRVFLIFGDGLGGRRCWSYGEFSEAVGRVANGLIRLGIRRGERINLHMTNRPEFLFFWFAAARLGAVIVPTNPLSPPDELAYPLSHAEAVLSVTLPELLENVEAARRQCPALRNVIVCGEDTSECDQGSGPRLQEAMGFSEFCGGLSGDLPPVDLDPVDDLAILYTSGTTSRPKGVIVTHANYVFAGEQISKNVGLSPDDRWLVTLPLFHGNAQYYSVMTAVTVGASIALMPRFSASRMMRQAAMYGCTVHSSLATPMRMVLAQEPAPDDGESGLRLVIFAQNLTPEQYEEWDRRYGVPLLQIYGMTETMGQPLVNPLNYRRDNSSIGLPAMGYECRLVDENGCEVPAGQPGQLIVSGIPAVTIMKGYFRDEENTDGALRDGWLWTGDIATVGEDGYFRFIDRAKELIRRSGENISAGEVEAVLKSHPAVEDAAVVGIPDRIYDEAVRAFVVLSEGADASAGDILDFCRARLSRFKVPGDVDFMEDFPRTSTGKVRKVELREAAVAALRGDGNGD